LQRYLAIRSGVARCVDQARSESLLAQRALGIRSGEWGLTRADREGAIGRAVWSTPLPSIVCVAT
jgi:hypothetical protein